MKTPTRVLMGNFPVLTGKFPVLTVKACSVNLHMPYFRMSCFSARKGRQGVDIAPIRSIKRAQTLFRPNFF